MIRRVWLFVLYLIVGVYLVNLTPFAFITIPDSIADFNKWIILAGAIMIILDSFRFLRKQVASG